MNESLSQERLEEIREYAEDARAGYDLSHSTDRCFEDVLELVAEVARQREIVEAAGDPFLVLLEAHPNAEPHVNEEMRRAADRLRKALAHV